MPRDLLIVFVLIPKKNGCIHLVNSDIGGYSGWIRGEEEYSNQEYRHKGLQDIWGNNGRHIKKEDREW